MKDFSPYTVELDSAKVQFLEMVTETYALADMGKALRCLINYARENDDKLDEIFAEVRCLDC